MGIIDPAKLYPKPVLGERILIEPLLLQPVTKYWDRQRNRRVIVSGWDGPILDLPEREKIYELYAWNVTFDIPAIIDIPQGCTQNYRIVSEKAKQNDGKVIFSRIRRDGKLIPFFECEAECK